MSEQQRGRLKIIMGYAAGVGKTYRMLEELHSLKADGVDVVIGYFEPHGRKDTIAKTEGLETVKRKTMTYREATFEEMDTDAILARHPQVCAVDEFPHTNVPGSARTKRWEDVQVLLDAGIHVITTMNIQHLESLNDQVWRITGIRVRETIPDWVVEQAHEVVMTDLTPRALLHRLERGVVYAPEKSEQARKNFFKEQILVALRELALRQAAHEVEQRIENAETLPAEAQHTRGLPANHHKILVLVTAAPETAALIRRAKRISDFLDAECFAVAVQPTGDLSGLADAQRDAIESHLNFARNLHLETRVLEGDDEATALVEFARRNHVTQIFVARPRETRGWVPVWSKSIVHRIVALAKDMQVVVVANPERVMH
jgi:two-component system sensor histidine kinase KdpD